MKLLLAVAFILCAGGVRSQDDCFARPEITSAIIALGPACAAEGVDLDSPGGLAVVCAQPSTSACRSGLDSIFTTCEQSLENFCRLAPTDVSAPTSTPDPITACFMSEENVMAFTQLFGICQAEGINLETIFSTDEAFCALPEGNCRNTFDQIYSSCGTPLSFICLVFTNLPTPSPSQAACVNNSEMTRAADIERDCGSENFFNIDLLRAQCAPGSPCRTLLNEIYVEACGYDLLSPICDNLPSPTATDVTDITDVTESTPDCLSQQSTILALGRLEQTCQSEINTNSDMGDEIFGQICTLDKGSVCRSGVTRIFENCGVPFDAVCVFENLPTPSPTQQQCLDNALQTRAADIMRECGSAEVDSFDDARSVCAKAGCRNLLRSVYSDGCGYNVVDTVCDSLTTDGAVNLYAVPLVVLIAVLMSVLF